MAVFKQGNISVKDDRGILFGNIDSATITYRSADDTMVFSALNYEGIDHADVDNLDLDDHLQYLNLTRAASWLADQDLNSMASGTVMHATMSGLDADDHTQYYNFARLDSWWTTKSGQMDEHSELQGLGADDHTQYHNDARAATWLSNNHETTYNHSSYDTHLGDDTKHRIINDSGSSSTELLSSSEVDGRITTATGALTLDHSELNELDFASSGHTGFASTVHVHDKIEELNTSIEVIDTGTDGHVKFTIDGTEYVRLDDGTGSDTDLLVGEDWINNHFDWSSSNRISVGNDGNSVIQVVGAGGTADIWLYHAHNTLASPAAAGGDVGSLAFLGNDGTGGAVSDYNMGAKIIAVVEGTPAAGDVPMRMDFETKGQGIGRQKRMRINSDGTVELTNGTGINEFSIDGTLSDDSDDAVPTEKAIKTYVDGKTWDSSDITDFTEASQDVIGTSISGINIGVSYDDGTGITTLSGSFGGGGSGNHSELNELDYASAGHTGFQAAGDYVTDSELTTVSGALDTKIDAKMTDLSDDTTPQLGGDLDLNGKCIDYGSILSVSGTYGGEKITVTVDDASTVFGDVLCQGADFNYDRADADTASTAPAYVMALTSGTGSNEVLIRGQICDTAWNWSAGKVYLSETLGGMTQTKPSNTGDQVQVLGWALSADTIFFDPVTLIVEVA